MLGEQEVDTEKEELDKEKEVADKKGGEMEENRVMVEKRQVKFYAAQLVSQQEAVRDRSVFMDTLRQFHAAMGTKFMVPVIGGKDLDLHLLYILVTQKGGIEKVIVEKKLGEVIAAFNFPRTTTSASFVLRKYYLSLLHQYEQVYLFGARGPLVPPSACLQTKTLRRKLGRTESLPDLEMAAYRRRKSTVTGPYNLPVTGRINGRFEHGYFVTVNVGSKTLHGILYHAPHSSASPSMAAQSNAIVPCVPPNQSSRRRRRYRNRDPAHPKPNRSAYNFFFAEKHAKLKVLHPNRERDFGKMIGEAWNRLTEEERKVYVEHGRRDKERYKREKLEYKESLKLAPTEVVRAKSTRDEASQGNFEG